MSKADVINKTADVPLSASDPEPFVVRSITPSLGVNTAWQQEQNKPLQLPAFQGVQQISQMALMFTLWSRVEQYLYGEMQVVPLSNAREEKKHLGILRESETSIICLLCLLNNEPYSAGRLVDAMIGQEATADQRGNARKRLVSRTLPVIADRYGLLQYNEKNTGNLREYRIGRSASLVEFAEAHLVTGVQQICNSEITLPDNINESSVSETENESLHKQTGNQIKVQSGELI